MLHQQEVIFYFLGRQCCHDCNRACPSKAHWESVAKQPINIWLGELAAGTSPLTSQEGAALHERLTLNSHRLLEWAPLSSQPKNTQAQWSLCHFRRKGGTGVSFNTAATAGCRGVSFMTSQSSSSEGGNSLSDKSHFLCFFLSPERSQTFGRGRQSTSPPFYCFEDETRWFCLVEVYIHQAFLQMAIFQSHTN